MKLRRALLLFAIVLGIAAIASSIARPPERESANDEPRRASPQSRAGGPASATPRPGMAPFGPTTIELRVGGKRQTRRLERGRPATLLVEVDTSAQVEIPSLGLIQPAEPLTPARFDVLAYEPGTHEIVLRPAAADAPTSTVGTLRIVRAR